MPAAFLRSADGVVYLSVKVQPRASRNEISGVHGNELKVKVTAPPVDSAANEALIEFIAERLGCSRSSIQLARGATSRHKVLAIRGVTEDQIGAALGG
ncbi:MAG TPA: DUF167 domain-containing protein [Candidatus Acidoferrum sp.]|nr:DUF167 domain-containing protein [Candidatus Acidoferrum sp.]